MEPEIQSISTIKGVITKLIRYNIDTKLDEIIPILNTTEKEKFVSFIHQKRKCEFYFTRFLWKKFKINESIEYDTHGIPTIQSGFVSISHSGNLIAISYHPTKRIGIDIQHYTPKIVLIKDKFANYNEYNHTSNTLEQDLTQIWCIKEAVYKMARIKGLAFKEIRINNRENPIHVTCEELAKKGEDFKVFIVKNSEWAMAISLKTQ